MSKVTRFAISTVLIALTGSVQAMIIDFKAEAEPAGLYGESAWDPFSLLADFGIDVDIYGANGSPGYVYLDANGAGMGVCGALKSGAVENSATNSGANLCDPSSDDNVTVGENLKFVFNEAVDIDKIWFNNNHDSDRSLIGDEISVFGVDYAFLEADKDLSRMSGTHADVVYDGGFSFAAGDIAYISRVADPDGEQFYLSAIEFYSVPEPATLALLSLGLLALSLTGWRSRAGAEANDKQAPIP